ncbi:hypothetical protein RND81_02G000200 [Saponaria officinalis]|uniref:Meiosis-specific protein ASY3-like coiled-coil domain-containing protein n=1 Tax=Saponaria officinalis TaxID=3572 RepID=A0AAW1MPJ0_SAPOF
MSHCPSSVHNCQPFSQSQKISIGIVVDSAAHPLPTNECELSNAHVPAEKETVHAQRSTVKHNVYQGTFSSSRRVQQTHFVQTAQNDALLEHGVGGKRDVDKEGKMSATDRRSESLSSVRKHASVPVIGVLPEQDNIKTRSKETLRMKLRQILGTHPFSYDKVDDAKTLNLSCHEIMQEQDVMGDHHSKPRQNSDTIETDSDNVSLTTKTPVTGSISRNKAPGAGRARNLKPKTLSCEKQAKQDRTGGATKSSGIKPGDLLPTTDLKNIQPVLTGDGKPTPVKELRLRSSTRTPPPHGFLNENIEVTMQDVNVNYSPAISEKNQLLESKNPVAQEKSEQHESFGFETLAPQDDGSNGPLFKMRKKFLNSPTGLFPVNNDKKQHVLGSPSKAGQSILEVKFLPMSSSDTESDSISLDDTATPDERHTSAQGSSIEEKDADNGLCTPVRGESDSTEEVSSMKREFGLVEKPTFSWNKRRRSQDAELDDFSPAFTIPKAGEETDDIFMEASEANADDGLARVLSLLGLALEKVKSKMALATNRRCLDILMSAAEEIHSQLQDVESQIQTDLGKLTCLETSKRKHLEIKLQEQQEQLMAVYEKFKEDIHKYLQECRGAVEGLETQHVEVKGTVEKQKASHRKLVLQAEAAVENHLVHAQQKIMSVQKTGKKKMQQLKVTVGECIKDVILG